MVILVLSTLLHTQKEKERKREKTKRDYGSNVCNGVQFLNM